MVALIAKRRTVICMAALLMAPLATAADPVFALKMRNPYLAELAARDPATFTKVALLILRAERAEGLTPEHSAPPQTAPTGRGMSQPFFDDRSLPQNPDILWLNNASPEGMHDLIGLLKSAGNRPTKP